MDAFITRKRPKSDDQLERTDIARGPSISPPPKRKALKAVGKAIPETIDLTAEPDVAQNAVDADRSNPQEILNNVVPSPVQLNNVKDLPSSSNVDTVKLSEILGDPMINECWLFNYLFEMDFVMKQFDPDTRTSVNIRLVHGSWKAEDRNGIGIIDAARRYPNIQVIKAYMTEAYGTHHSKMIVLFRHDDLAQVILLTGNFIERDWSMSQAIWRSPLLPLLEDESGSIDSFPSLGSGPRFKHDLSAYFRGYGPGKLHDLINQLSRYDFSNVRGALIASVPGKQNVQSMDPEFESLWGWPGLKRILSGIPSVPTNASSPTRQPQIVAQISSVAAVGEKWLTNTFLPALSTTPKSKKPQPDPKTSIIFPTADEIRRSVDGYSAGPSIHMKISSPAQAKQLDVLRPMLCHWAGDSKPTKASFFDKSAASSVREAGRRRAAPHIKTYVRFNDGEMKRIDWAMVTSANLSTQAWGGGLTPGGEVRICSYEIGVVAWPALWDEEGKQGSAEMVPVFKRDAPALNDRAAENEEGVGKTVVGWRMPYDLPLVPYAANEKPWCASEPCGERDWKGQSWPGYEK